MNYGQEYLAKDELELSVASLLRACFKNIKWILLGAILFAILVPVFMYIRTSDSNVQTEIQLSKTEQSVVDNYVVLHEKLAQSEIYKEKSPLMNLDFNHVYQIIDQYYVQADETIQKNITAGIVAYINSKECLDEFCQKAGLETIYYTQEYFVATIEEESDGVITIKVRTSVEEDSLRCMAILKELLMKKHESLIEVIGIHNLVLLQESMETGYCMDVYEAQNIFYEEVTEIKKSMTTLKNSMSDVQKLAVMQQCDAELILIDAHGTSMGTWIKYVCLGLALGVVLSTMFIVLCDLFNGKLQSEKELAKRLQITHLGTVRTDVVQEEIAMTSIRIMKLLEAEGKKEVDFISTEDGLSQEKILNLCSILEENHIHTNVLGDIIVEKHALEQLSSTKPVILVETIGKSMVSKIYQEAELCRDMKVVVMGYITILTER